jgi:sporulation protein YqfC
MKNTDNIVTFIREPHIEIFSNSECIIDGLKGIMEYTDEKIKVNLGKYAVSVLGDELYINSFSHNGAIINGNIISVEFGAND